MGVLRFFAIVLLVVAPVVAQSVAPATRQVNPDGSVTFHYAAPSAKQVQLSIDAFAKALPMTRDDAGMWSVTTPALLPEWYGYSFVVDGVPELDPTNTDTRANYVYGGSNLLVPGHPAMPWELTDIAHGSVTQHYFTTHVAKHLPENQSTYLVYTPPGYDARKKGGYPVLYLLHGWSDYATGWTDVGKANFILDSLIDAGKAKPMIVVMPLGYGDLDFVTHGFKAWNDVEKVDSNVALYSQSLLTEVLPAVEREYNVAAGRQNRAIAGLSMGGLESLSIGLHHPETFAYVGGFSSALFRRGFAEHFPEIDAAKSKLSLLWIACGTGDELLEPNREFVTFLKAKSFDVKAVETPGAHTWLVWRDNLLSFAPLLFQGK